MGYRTQSTYHNGWPIDVTPDWQGRIHSLLWYTLAIAEYKYVGSRVAQRTYTMPFPDIVYQPSYDNLGRITSADSSTSYAKFDYQYEPNSHNISEQKYDHRGSDPCSDFTYDDLDRLLLAAYGTDDTNEVFTMDDLGNRSTVNVRDGNDVNYVVDSLTNRYNTVGDANLSYDSAGNLTADKDGYGYQYDYENRIVEINDVNGTVIAEFAYDALGRRIRKIDSDANETTHYYYNNNWQVLCEYDGSGTFKAWYAYGNYIDEVLMRGTSVAPIFTKFYVHDHLYSPAALAAWAGTVVERYEYDAYGSPYILEPNFAADPDGKSDYGNPYYFQGKSLDLLDGGGLEFMSWPYRDYSTYLGRWLQAEKLGMIPNDNMNVNTFNAHRQYREGMSLYEFVDSRPSVSRDPWGLSRLTHIHGKIAAACKKYDCKECCDQGVRYRDWEKRDCWYEARILATKYHNRFTRWAAANPGYHMCTHLAYTIKRMNLDAGLRWFDLKKMLAGDQGYVGVFHRCNKDFHRSHSDRGTYTPDKRFDPWRLFVFRSTRLTPDVKAPLTGMILED